MILALLASASGVLRGRYRWIQGACWLTILAQNDQVSFRERRVSESRVRINGGRYLDLTPGLHMATHRRMHPDIRECTDLQHRERETERESEREREKESQLQDKPGDTTVTSAFRTSGHSLR